MIRQHYLLEIVDYLGDSEENKVNLQFHHLEITTVNIFLHTILFFVYLWEFFSHTSYSVICIFI